MNVAFVFPGQGSQCIGMMNGYSDLPVVRETFSEASDILGKDFWAMVKTGTSEELNLTVNTQPVMLVADVSVYRAWLELGGRKPAALAGHSLGEYSALVAAGSIDFADALSLVYFRARVMQEAVPEEVGGMAAVLGLDDDTIKAVCAEVTDKNNDGEILEPANFNSIGQVVMAGHKKALLRGIDLVKENGAKRAVLLPMSIPSHCALMCSAAKKMQQKLAEMTVRSPKIPVLHNVDAKHYHEPSDVKDVLVKQLYSPVQWVKTVQELSVRGVTHILECGPGKVLSGLNKRIERNLQSIPLIDSQSIRQLIDKL